MSLDFDCCGCRGKPQTMRQTSTPVSACANIRAVARLHRALRHCELPSRAWPGLEEAQLWKISGAASAGAVAVVADKCGKKPFSGMRTDHTGRARWLAVWYRCCVPDGLPRGPGCRLARAGRPRLGILNAGRPAGCRCASDRRRQKRLPVL